MNVAKYVQTAAAIMHGLHNYPSTSARPFALYGVVGNRVGSDNHNRILEETLSDKYLGNVRRDDNLQLSPAIEFALPSLSQTVLSNTLRIKSLPLQKMRRSVLFILPTSII